MKHLKSITLLSCATVLAACGGSSGSNAHDGPVEPTVSQSGLNEGGLVPSYDPTTETITMSAGMTEIIIRREGRFGNGAVDFYRADPNFAYYGETLSGYGTALAVIVRRDDFDAAETVLERIGTTNVPVSGTANYTGDYAGIMYGQTSPSEPIVTEIVIGDVELEAGFDTMTISGAITGRIIASAPSFELADVLLEGTMIKDGGFSGTTTGGEGLFNSGATRTANDGIYEGLLTGTDATEVVGALTIEHTIDFIDEVEIGVFVAKKEP